MSYVFVDKPDGYPGTELFESEVVVCPKEG